MRPSWQLPTLRVNSESRQRTLLANPNKLELWEYAGPGGGLANCHPPIYSNAANNIIHFDYQALFAMGEATWNHNRRAPEPRLWRFVGFGDIQNISVPKNGNFNLLWRLRDLGAVEPDLPVLSGVTYVEAALNLPGTISTCQQYVTAVTADYQMITDFWRHHTQQTLINRSMDKEIGQGVVMYQLNPIEKQNMISSSWANWAAFLPGTKGQGVRAPLQ